MLAVTVLLEQALRRRTITIEGWQFALRWPTWPLFTLWGYFGGSVAGNVVHAPQILAAQLVAAVPPISAAFTFHLLLRLLDRARALRGIAEAHEERAVEERERAARRKARQAQLKNRTRIRDASVASAAAAVSGNGGDPRLSPTARDSNALMDVHRTGAAEAPARDARHRSNGSPQLELEDLRRRVQAGATSGDRVTGEIVGQWLGVSARTGRRRLAALLEDERDS